LDLTSSVLGVGVARGDHPHDLIAHSFSRLLRSPRDVFKVGQQPGRRRSRRRGRLLRLRIVLRVGLCFRFPRAAARGRAAGLPPRWAWRRRAAGPPAALCLVARHRAFTELFDAVVLGCAFYCWGCWCAYCGRRVATTRHTDLAAVQGFSKYLARVLLELCSLRCDNRCIARARGFVARVSPDSSEIS
jgi:hypothetical protein